ncbi:PD-(D/E)XK nuclease family protein [Formosa haliotis]|uniref:PDDEXK-like family protein n=1 Tax=Formosa haliotis TaxID=1555194 RepID=UPI0008247146|nr:PD-(D/E)XK nuclease family protein [Formosa haliotis]
MKSLLKHIAQISKKYAQLNKISGDAFNVFEVINVTTDEVRLHSRFLAELLNPKGTHGQGDLFLKHFVDQFKIQLDTKSAKVTVEKYIGPVTEITGGLIDIFISDNKGASITIENKIYAPDQNNQLIRYYNHSQNNIFYLTLLGTEPSEDSYINTKVNPNKVHGKTKLNPKTDFKLLSYKYDIKDWLILCRKESVELPLLREGITHYLNLINTLTGQSGNNKMNTEITEFITSTEDHLKHAVLIEQSLTDSKIKIQSKFWEHLKEKLEANSFVINDALSVTKENIQNYYIKNRNRDVEYGLIMDVYKKEHLKIQFKVELHLHIYYGFQLIKNEGLINQTTEECSMYTKILDGLEWQYENSERWLGRRFTDEKLNFRAFNSDAIFELANPEKLDKKTTIIANSIKNEIDAFQEQLKAIDQLELINKKEIQNI